MQVSISHSGAGSYISRRINRFQHLAYPLHNLGMLFTKTCAEKTSEYHISNRWHAVCFDRINAYVPAFYCPDSRSSIGKDHAVNSLRIVRGKPLGNHSAKRETANMRPLDLQGVEK